MGFDGPSLQRPPVACQLVAGFDQPQRRPPAETLFHLLVGELGVQYTGHLSQIFGTNLRGAFLPLHRQRAREVWGRRGLHTQVAIKQDAAARK